MLVGLICQKRKLKCLNTSGRKLQRIEYYSYRKPIPLMTLSPIDGKILKAAHILATSCVR